VALLHVIPLPYLLAATVSVLNLLLIHEIPAAHVTVGHDVSFTTHQYFLFFLQVTELQFILEPASHPATHQFLLLKYPVWLGTAGGFKIL